MIGKNLQALLTGRPTAPGPVKWCKQCSRFHPARKSCNLVAISVKAKSGNTVTRFVHSNRIGEGI